MRREVFTAAAGLAVCTVLAAGCGVQPSGLEEGPVAPTGLAPGRTLYFLDGEDQLVAQQRQTGRLGTVAETVSLLLTGPGNSEVSTGIAPATNTHTDVTITANTIVVRVPLASDEVTPDGADQIVCTTVASHVQAGGPAETNVRILFTDLTSGAGGPRTCPII